MRMNQSLGYIMFMAGLGMLLVSFVFPMVIIVLDDSPPLLGGLTKGIIPKDGVTYLSLSELVMYCIDQESGVKSVTCKIDATNYDLALFSAAGVSDVYEIWKYTFPTPGFVVSGSHTYSFTVTNNVALTITRSGSFIIYNALQGKWYVNNVEIKSTSQTVYATSTTVSFKFAKTAGIADSSITCTVTEGASTLVTLTNSAVATWTGNYTFSAGTHTLELKASDGTQTVTMSVIGMQIGPTTPKLPQLNTLQILGLASTGIGLLLIFTGRRKGG